MTCVSKIALKSFILVFIFSAMFLFNINLFIMENNGFLRNKFDHRKMILQKDVNQEKKPKRFDHLKNLRYVLFFSKDDLLCDSAITAYYVI